MAKNLSISWYCFKTPDSPGHPVFPQELIHVLTRYVPNNLLLIDTRERRVEINLKIHLCKLQVAGWRVFLRTKKIRERRLTSKRLWIFENRESAFAFFFTFSIMGFVNRVKSVMLNRSVLNWSRYYPNKSFVSFTGDCITIFFKKESKSGDLHFRRSLCHLYEHSAETTCCNIYLASLLRGKHNHHLLHDCFF